jgi:hypothetical protein
MRKGCELALSDALAADQCEMKSSADRFGMARSIAGRKDTRQVRVLELSKFASWVAVNCVGHRWHVACGAAGVWARHRRFAHNEAQRNEPNQVGTRSDFWRRGETGAVVWWEAGRRKASSLPGAAEDWFWGRCDGGSFATALMRGVPAEGIWRNLRAHGGGAACLQRFETVERSGPTFVRASSFAGATADKTAREAWRRGPVERLPRTQRGGCRRKGQGQPAGSELPHLMSGGVAPGM